MISLPAATCAVCSALALSSCVATSPFSVTTPLVRSSSTLTLSKPACFRESLTLSFTDGLLARCCEQPTDNATASAAAALITLMERIVVSSSACDFPPQAHPTAEMRHPQLGRADVLC